MSGEAKYSKQLDEWDSYLDKSDEKVGLLGAPNSVLRYFELTEPQIRSFSAEDCGEAAALLDCFAFKIQKYRNKLASQKFWCEEKLKRELAPIMARITAYSYDERRGMALMQSAELLEIEKSRVATEGATIRLDYMTTRVDSLSSTFKTLQATKRKVKNYDN